MHAPLAPHQEPRLLAPYATKPGETPREVLLQRLRKAYQRFDIEGALQEAGLDHRDAQTARERGSRFALSAFDDETFESRTHREWVPHNASAPATARALLLDVQNTGTYHAVHVTDVDASSNAYCVAPIDTDDRGGHQGTWLHRLFICFDAEDPQRHVARLVSAYHARRDAEAALMRALVIDSMPHHELPQLGIDQINRVLASALNSKALKAQLKLLDTSMLVNEVNIDFARTLNQITLEHMAATEITVSDSTMQRASGHALASKPPLEAPLPTLPLPAAAPTAAARRAPARGTWPLEAHDFPAAFSHFVFASLLTKSEVIVALGRVRSECVKVMDKALFHLHHGKTMSVLDFLQVCIQPYSVVMVLLLLLLYAVVPCLP